MFKRKSRVLAIIICMALILASLPISAFADRLVPDVTLTEGDIEYGFAPSEAECSSSDPSVAWIDSDGNLNALKAGTATVSVPGKGDFTVSINDYTDGSEVIGNLKILARYNDSMQFYDGHVYLLFTSYQDGVEVCVNDLYAAYEISDEYYADINDDISNGSNHTGNDADKYFSFNDETNTLTLDRGEIVTIGMYRGFDLTVPQAAIGSIKNSSAWSSIEAAGKTAIVESIFQMLSGGSISIENAMAKIIAACADIGLDYNKLLDGVVPGGVCFNRELYNQKLEWDQFENVTYELDITKNQFDTMMMYLNGNLNKFSILKNSCATVALRAWNAAIGSRNGEDTAYKLSYAGEGIFSIIDAPKSVRDSIKARLPGFYLNNSSIVEEPDAGYQDDTGFVYVSAPEKVSPIDYLYSDGDIQIDTYKTKLSSLISAAKKDKGISYNKDYQQITVDVISDTDGEYTTVNRVDFTINGKTVSADSNNLPDSGAWFKVKVENPIDGENYVAFDENDNVLPSDYENGYLSFFAASLPLTFKIGTGESVSGCVLQTNIEADEYFSGNTEVYYIEDGEKILIDELAELDSDTKVYIKATADEYDCSYILYDIIFNGNSVFDNSHYDSDEEAYYVVLPNQYSVLDIIYYEMYIATKDTSTIQITVGDTFDITDYISTFINREEADYSKIGTFIYDDIGIIKDLSNNRFEGVKEGFATIDIYAEDNENISTMLSVEVYDDFSDMCSITYDEEKSLNFAMVADADSEYARAVAFNGYLVKKGTPITVYAYPNDNMAVLQVLSNGKPLKHKEAIIVNEDTYIDLTFAEAHVEGVPDSINLTSLGDTYQFNPIVKYDGSLSDTPVYDDSFYYELYDNSVVEIDENGLLTVIEPIPESGYEVTVTVYAASSGYQVSKECKVVLGEKKSSDIVGKLTIWARPYTKSQPMPHAAIAFTTYEDVDLDISYYNYCKPNEKYNNLMLDYAEHPENYSSDPALYNDNELGIRDRESYFDIIYSGPKSQPKTVSLKAGETLTMSNYGFESVNLLSAIDTLRKSSIAVYPQAQELLRQMQLFADGKEIDGPLAFDSMFSTLMQAYTISKFMGTNPIDGETDGGLLLNREIYNQFIRNDSQEPNTNYTVEITADELEMLKKYLSDPNNNYYSLFNKNCSSSTVEIWNSVFEDRPELQVKGNFTGFMHEPQSLFFEISKLLANEELGGNGGVNMYPRTLSYNTAKQSDPTSPDISFDNGQSKTESGKDTAESLVTSNPVKRSPVTGDINSIPLNTPVILTILAAGILLIIYKKNKKEI